MFSRVTIFQGSADSVDGPIRFPVKTLSDGMKDLPGFLGLFDLADRETGQTLMVTFWATQEARAASAEFARNATNKVAEETGEQVLSVREYEVGHYILGDGLAKGT
jgi:heme-degrading monooxygenase HmoA